MSFFTLKLVALLSMLFDHVTSVWPVSWFVWDLFFPHATETPHIALAIQSLTDYIGRIAAPVFLFFIANGYRYTHSVKQYALRLLVFACLSEWPYYLLFGMHGNIIFTLFWGLITLWLFEHGNRLHPWLGWTLAAAVILVAEVLARDPLRSDLGSPLPSRRRYIDLALDTPMGGQHHRSSPWSSSHLPLQWQKRPHLSGG